MKRVSQTILTTIAGLALAGPASAALIQINTDATVAASNTDLLQTSQLGVAILTGSWIQESTTGAPGALSDGVAATAGGVSPRYKVDKDMYGTPSNNATVTFSLDTGASPQGYNFTGIDFYHGWGDDGRDGFRFTIEYSIVGDANFTTYDSTVTFDPAANYGRTGVTDSNGMIASNVDQIRITPFAIENGYGGLAEIDVFGTAVPEPSGVALLGLGGLALILLRRRK